MSHAEYFAWLYSIGTGWLGWTEAETLNSTMAGIVRAYEGRVAMVNSIAGGLFGTASAKPKQPVEIGKRFRAMFSAMGTKKVARTAKGTSP